MCVCVLCMLQSVTLVPGTVAKYRKSSVGGGDSERKGYGKIFRNR